jgi:deoxyribodipyrimidine photolyase-related protein
MSTFRSQLDNRNPSHDPDERTWVFVPYDQLTDRVGPLDELPADEAGIVLVETSWKGDRRPYHRQKLALTLACQRHFALEQADRGVAVTYLTGGRRYAAMLREFAADYGPLVTMRPAERELRADLAELDGDLLDYRTHEGWLTDPDDFRTSQDGTPWRMDSFYQRIRRETGILMEDGSPVGGKFSFDADNREFWSGDPPAPDPPTFDVDPVTAEVGELIRDKFDHHPGNLDLAQLPTTADDADRAWQWALGECMEHFGPFEDAMSRSSRTLFHTRISPLVNLHRLLPARVLEDVVELDIPLNSKEGFVRQLIGWREFMRHVHRETDGFRNLPEDFEALDHPPAARNPRTGGWEKWRGDSWDSPDAEADSAPATLDGGALPNYLDAEHDVPPAFWGEPSGLNCLDTVVDSVLEEGWSHHITRLMVLSNIATLLGVEPRALTDWFWVTYIDAFDWVVEPNVLGMGTFGLGDLFVTKPYVSGSNYIDKMSDYCADCQFDPGEDCPLKPMYWAFLDEQEDALDDNPRMGLMLGMMRKRDDPERESARATLERVRDLIDAGERLTPAVVETDN